MSLVGLQLDRRDDTGMPNRPAAALALRDGDREELTRLTRSSSVRAGLAQRARIVLLAADWCGVHGDSGKGWGPRARR